MANAVVAAAQPLLLLRPLLPSLVVGIALEVLVLVGHNSASANLAAFYPFCLPSLHDTLKMVGHCLNDGVVESWTYF